MKKLNTNNTGRMPLWQADLDWIQQAYTGPIEAIVKELGIDDDYFVVTGCQVTHDVNQLSMTAGWMWWDGELLPVRPLEATPTVSIWLRLIRVTHSDPNGSRNFIKADQSTELVEDVWQDDYIQPVMMTNYSPNDEGAGVYIRTGAPTLAEQIRKNAVRDGESQWTTISGLADPESLQYKQIGRTVVLKGQVAVRDDATAAATGLPAPLGGKASLVTWKTLAQFVGTHYNHLLVDGQLYAYVNSSGNLIVRQTDVETQGVYLVSLDGMTYLADEPYTSSPIGSGLRVIEP